MIITPSNFMFSTFRQNTPSDVYATTGPATKPHHEAPSEYFNELGLVWLGGKDIR